MHGLGHRVNCPQALQAVTHRKSRCVELPDHVNLILKRRWIPNTDCWCDGKNSSFGAPQTWAWGPFYSPVTELEPIISTASLL